MFRAITRTQWKSSRGLVLLATILAFAIPIASFRTATDVRAQGGLFLGAIASWSVAYSVAAAGIGLSLAMIAWSPDHRGRHVYALTLPVARWRYVLMRLGAGALFIAAPVAALLVSAEVVAHSSSIPIGLQAFPIALTIRFTIAALVAYALFFAITAATARTAGIIITIIAVFCAATYLAAAADVHTTFFERTIEWIFATPGLLSVFTGRWMLIDA